MRLARTSPQQMRGRNMTGRAFQKQPRKVTGDTQALLVANLRTIDVAELLKVTEGMP